MRKVLNLFVVFSLFWLSFAPQAKASPGPVNEWEYIDSISIPSDGPDVSISEDDAVLAGNIFIPTTPGPHPMLILPASWGIGDQEYLAQAQRFADDGFIVFSYTARGFFDSTGMIEIAGKEDMADIKYVIDWLIGNVPVLVSGVSVDENNIGMLGISYGAGISLLSSINDTRIQTVYTMSGWGSLEEALYGNNTLRLFWGELLLHTGESTGTLDPVIQQYFDYLWHGTAAQVEETLDWAGERSPLNFYQEYNDRNIPIFLASNLGDELFPPNAEMAFFSKLTNPENRMRLYPGNHATMEAFGLAGIPSEVWADSHAWFNYYLQDIDTPLVHDPNRVTISLKNEGAQNRDDVLTFADWPNSKVVQNKYYLGPRTETTNGTISVTPYSGKSNKNLILAGIESGAHSGVPVLSNTFEAYTEYTVKTFIDDIDRNNAVVYESIPLTADQTIVGIPRVSVWIIPQLNTAGMVAYLYDVDPATRVGVLLTNGPVSLHNTIPGQAVPVTFDMIMTSYRVPAGHTLALVIDTYDVLYAPATPLPYTLQFLYSGFQQPSLSLPILKP